MKIDQFKGMDVRENRWTADKNACQIATNVKVDRGRLGTLPGCTRVNSKAFDAGILGIYDYRPKGATGSLMKFIDDGTITKDDPDPTPTPLVFSDTDTGSVLSPTSVFFQMTAIGTDLYAAGMNSDDPPGIGSLAKLSGGTWSVLYTAADWLGVLGVVNDGTNIYILYYDGSYTPYVKIWNGSTLTSMSFPTTMGYVSTGGIHYCNGVIYVSTGPLATGLGTMYKYESGAWVLIQSGDGYLFGCPFSVGTTVYVSYSDGVNPYNVCRYDGGTTLTPIATGLLNGRATISGTIACASGASSLAYFNSATGLFTSSSVNISAPSYFNGYIYGVYSTAAYLSYEESAILQQDFGVAEPYGLYDSCVCNGSLYVSGTKVWKAA